MELTEITRIIEALLVAAESPLTTQQLSTVVGAAPSQIQEGIEALRQQYQTSARAFTIEHVAGGFQLATDPSLGAWIRKLYKTERSDRVSQAGLETLAIVAYRQPMTRAEIEHVRGVNVDGVMHTLLERGLIKILGRKDAPGRPVLYGTTSAFLQHFGLNAISDLPPLSEAPEMPQMAQEVR